MQKVLRFCSSLLSCRMLLLMMGNWSDEVRVELSTMSDCIVC